MRGESGASVFIATSLEWGLEGEEDVQPGGPVWDRDQSGVDRDHCGGPLHIC